MEAGIATDITTDAHTTVTDVPGAQATSSTGTANCFSDRAGQKAVSLTSKEAPSTVAADVTAAADSTVLASGSIVNSEASRSGLPAQVWFKVCNVNQGNDLVIVSCQCTVLHQCSTVYLAAVTNSCMHCRRGNMRHCKCSRYMEGMSAVLLLT